MNLKPIHEQVAVIFGASSGIGRATALTFAQRGASVVVSARSEGDLQSLVDEIRQAGGEAIAIPAEVTDFEQVKAVADGAVNQYGRLDTWVHLAGVSIYGHFDQLAPEEFKRVIDVNLTGQAYGAMAALPHLKREGRGALIHISSVLGQRAVPLQSPYCASKHGIEGMLDALRVELMHEQVPISVTNVHPSSINTPFFNHARTKLGVQPSPLGPVYQPQLVADAIAYAAVHPVRDVTVGGAGKTFEISQRISPGLVDVMLRIGGFETQKTSWLKSEDAPDNLFAPIDGSARIEGDFSHRAVSGSPYTWMELQQVPLAFGVAFLEGFAGLVNELFRGIGTSPTAPPRRPYELEATYDTDGRPTETTM